MTSFISEFHEGMELKAMKEVFLLQSVSQLKLLSSGASLNKESSPVQSAVSFCKFCPSLSPSSMFSPVSHLALCSALVCPIENHRLVFLGAPEGFCLGAFLFLPLLFLHSANSFCVLTVRVQFLLILNLILLCIQFPAPCFCCLICIRPNNLETA